MAGIIPEAMRLYVAELYTLFTHYLLTVIYCILGTYVHITFIVHCIYSQISVHIVGLHILGHHTIHLLSFNWALHTI